MTVNNRVRILVIAVAVIGIWVGIRLTSDPPEIDQLDNATPDIFSEAGDSFEQKSPSSNEASTVQENSPESNVNRDELSKTVADIRNAPNAIQAQELITKARSDGNQNQAAWAERELAKLCSSSWVQNSVSGDIKYNKQAISKIAEYCDGWYPSLTDEELEQAVSSSSDSAFNTEDLHKIIAATDSINRPELIKDLIATAQTPTELGNVFKAIVKLNGQEPVYSSLGMEAQMSQQDFRDAMQLAEILTSCQMFSGCGADSLFVLSFCATAPPSVCTSGSTYQDIAAYASSPYLLDQATQLYDFLLNGIGG